MSDEAVVTTAGDEPIRPTFPVHVIAFGIQAVLIPKTEYEALTKCFSPAGAAHRLSAIDKDSEIRTFILDRLGTEDVSSIRAAAVKIFGSGRVPSKSAVGRFVVKTRAAEGAKGRKRPR